MKEREVVRGIMWPFMSGIAYIHALGIVHRDIKLENTLFSADGTLKIADFGLSVDLRVEAPVTRLGTLDYMSPGVQLKVGIVFVVET
jgi:serine/threonine protein kinase